VQELHLIFLRVYPLRNAHEDLLVKISIQECRLHIYLVDVPTMLICEHEESPERLMTRH